MAKTEAPKATPKNVPVPQKVQNRSEVPTMRTPPPPPPKKKS
jgi:hypothetical protein